MNTGKLKEHVLAIYLVGAIGFSTPGLRPLFILLTPLCLLLTTAFLVWDFCVIKSKRPTAKLLAYLAGVYMVSLLVEMAGVHTGTIFGAYTYGRGLGFRVAGTPLLIGINWVLLVVASGALFSGIKNRWHAALGAAATMVGYDVVMEQVCHHMEMWSWEGGRIPFRNYAVWFALSLLFHSGAVLLRIRFCSSLARWIFYVQLGFFIWLFLFFSHFSLVIHALAVAILFSLLVRGIVSGINFKQQPILPSGHSGTTDMVSVLIPARDEEKNIGTLLTSLAQQHYSQVEYIVCDDQSGDATASIVQETMKFDPRLSLIEGTALPPGWTGKNHACHQLSQSAQGRYLLYLDADVSMAPDFIESAVHYMRQHELALLTLFPEQRMQTVGEWLTVPLMYRILLSLLPLELVRRAPPPALAAANGQCMLFDAEVYRRLSPHTQVRDQRTEDIAIARFLKVKGERVACLLGNRMVFCRMYASYRTAVGGFSRNVADFFSGHYALAILFGLTSTTLLYPIVLAQWPLLALTAVVANMGVAQLNSVTANQSLFRAALFQIPQELTFWHLLLRSIACHLKGGHLWKRRWV